MNIYDVIHCAYTANTARVATAVGVVETSLVLGAATTYRISYAMKTNMDRSDLAI